MMLIAGALILIVTFVLFGWLLSLPYRLNVHSKIEKETKVEITDIPSGREFDKHFLSVMKRSEGRHKLNDRDRKIMSILYEQEEFEIMKEEIERSNCH